MLAGVSVCVDSGFHRVRLLCVCVNFQCMRPSVASVRVKTGAYSFNDSKSDVRWQKVTYVSAFLPVCVRRSLLVCVSLPPQHYAHHLSTHASDMHKYIRTDRYASERYRATDRPTYCPSLFPSFLPVHYGTLTHYLMFMGSPPLLLSAYWGAYSAIKSFMSLAIGHRWSAAFLPWLLLNFWMNFGRMHLTQMNLALINQWLSSHTSKTICTTLLPSHSSALPCGLHTILWQTRHTLFAGFTPLSHPSMMHLSFCAAIMPLLLFRFFFLSLLLLVSFRTSSGNAAHIASMMMPFTSFSHSSAGKSGVSRLTFRLW
mmetsp:Transcript_3883/g.9785  ORF Transcript_3883/g.9785 Transcript_3883/m.9785 type:complete len:314 (-) Transcript_3883:217-1158(-)